MTALGTFDRTADSRKSGRKEYAKICRMVLVFGESDPNSAPFGSFDTRAGFGKFGQKSYENIYREATASPRCTCVLFVLGAGWFHPTQGTNPSRPAE
jgi:hypothetical protein